MYLDFVKKILSSCFDNNNDNDNSYLSIK